MSNMQTTIENGTLDFDKLWVPTAKNKIIRASTARNRLRVGGTGSSKSSDAMMDGIKNYLLSWSGCYGLILRRTMDDLRMSNIPDFKAYIPNDLFKFNESTAIATFYNGSKLFFSHMTNFSMKDLESYQSASFPWIFIDECGAFPGEVWTFLQSRNRVNPQCKPNDYGEYPIPCMMGATNPIGAHWGWYLEQFVEKHEKHKPDFAPDGSKRDRNGRWWAPVGEDWRLVYDPFEWDFVHSTIMDNPHMLAKDPDIVSRLSALPPGQREKLLDGYMDSAIGQYFDCFDPQYDVVNLREDTDQIIWQDWQPRWLGWDWGRAHWNTVFWFTYAQVKSKLTREYHQKVVCYREYVDRGKDHVEMAEIVDRFTRLGLPGTDKGKNYRGAWFSHEKFAKTMEAEDQQSKLSKELRARGLPGLTPATRNRVGRATLMYNLIKRRELVILDTCPELIRAIPQCVRDEDNLEDVLKVDTKADDIYDGASYGLFGMLGEGKTPQEEIDKRKIAEAPYEQSKFFTQYKLTQQREAAQKKATERRPAHWG